MSQQEIFFSEIESLKFELQGLKLLRQSDLERENGKMISRTHEVTKDGEVIHQHQNYTGKHGGERQFPDEWTGTKTINAPYENIPPSFPADRVPGGR